MTILATDIDPTPWGAWLGVIGGALTIVVIIVGALVALWKLFGRTDVRNVIREELAERDKAHAAEHAELEQRITNLDKATDASFRYVHGRIDDVILGRAPRIAP